MHVSKSFAAALAAAAGIAAPAGVPAATAQAVTAQTVTTAVPLPIAHYSHMLLDPAHHHLFITSGNGYQGTAGYSSILVTNYAGQTVATIPDQPGATGLALSGDGSTVYAALAGVDAVSAISTSSLTETARYRTGLDDPVNVAYTSGRVWFGWGAGTQGGIGSIDPSTSTVTVNAAPWNGFSAPMVTASPGGELVAGQPGESPAQLATYNVSSGGATPLAPEQEIPVPGTDGYADNLGSFQITPDGKDVVTASAAPSYQQVLRVSDLSADGTYPTTAYPDSVSISADGLVAAGTGSIYDNDIFMFAPGGRTPLATYNFGTNNSLATDGAALTPDSSELFAVTTTPSGDSPTLHVIPSPAGPSPAGAVQGYHALCLDNYGSSASDGTKIDLYTCNGTGAQYWTLNATQGPDGNYTGELVNGNGMCVNDAGYGGAGSKVILWSCTGTINEVWTYWPAYQEYSVTYGGHTYCMNDPGYSTTPGTQQIVWTCPDTANEQYTLPH